MLSRVEKIREARRLRALGWTAPAIGRELGVSESTVRNWYLGGDCIDCGVPIEGSNGRKARYCSPCFKAMREPEHGTLSRYTGGCRCDDCRRAQRDYMRSLKGRPAPSHGLSGYMNYRCRCETCRAAHNEYMKSDTYAQYRAISHARARGTEPRRHGTTYAYLVYGCRCDVCRAANAAASRRWRARRKQAA